MCLCLSGDESNEYTRKVIILFVDEFIIKTFKIIGFKRILDCNKNTSCVN